LTVGWKVKMKKNIGTYIIRDLELAKTTDLNIIYDGSTKNLKQRKSGHKSYFNKACMYPGYGAEVYQYMAEVVGFDKNKFSKRFVIELLDYMPHSTDLERKTQESLNWQQHKEEGHPILNFKDPLDNVPIVALIAETNEYVGHFDSMNAAEKELEVETKYIRKVLMRLWTQSGGYTFCHAEEYYEGWTPRDSKRCKPKQKMESVEVKATQVETKEVLSFPSIHAGIRYVVDKFNKNPNTVSAAIRRAINGVEPTAYGYKWETVDNT